MMKKGPLTVTESSGMLFYLPQLSFQNEIVLMKKHIGEIFMPSL